MARRDGGDGPRPRTEDIMAAAVVAGMDDLMRKTGKSRAALLAELDEIDPMSSEAYHTAADRVVELGGRDPRG